MTSKCTPGQAFLWTGMILGNLEYLAYIIWAITAEFTQTTTQKTCWIFIITQPLWLMFVYILYMGQHSDIRSGGERCKKIGASLPMALAMQTKLLTGFDGIHHRFCLRFNTPDVKFNLMTIENLYRVQTFVELFLLTVPMMIIVSAQSNAIEWSLMGRLSIILAALMFAKNLSVMTIFIIRKFIDGAEDPPMRPRTHKQKMSRVEMEAFNHIQSYLIEPHDDGMDGDGNTTVHQLMRYEKDWFNFEAQLADLPHHLFMLNKFGQTPLDVAILETIATIDVQNERLRETRKAKKEGGRRSEQEIEESLENATEKAQMLILRMQKYSPDCSIKFIQKPHRLDLMFETSFAMAIKKNKNDILDLFPINSIKTVYCSAHQLKDYKQYKEDKERHVELLTTPLHLACQSSNIEAVRQLIELQNYDVNVLLNEKNFVVELLQNSGYLDFSILNMIMKKKRPQINSGGKLALSQAILRGNPFMINALLEHGEASPFVRDNLGKSPIHIAAAKLNRDVFEQLIRTTGADPMMPDADGNTFLHIMALGVIKDTEYDFIRQMVVRHGLRLTCNKKGQTPLNMIKTNAGQQIALRGQPNFKRKIATFFEDRLKENPTFSDSLQEPVQHAAIKAGDLAALQACVAAAANNTGKVTKEVMDLLEQRDRDGKTCFFAAVEQCQTQIIDYLLDTETYPNLDIFNCRDTMEGDTPLHVAVRTKQYDLTKKLFDQRPEKCMQPNFKGHSPLFVAVQCQDMAMLEIFQEYKNQALQKRDYLGENPLFECARNGNEDIFNWFCGRNEFFKARGMQNYKGQTIEHIVCINKQHPIVDEIRPRPDIVDYYGNLPLYYTLRNNDVPMLQKYFHSTREYFNLRNYKYETIFHICAKHNALEALEQLLDKTVFLPQLLKKDYVGNTPIHVAAKSGSLETLQFLCTAATSSFLKMQNDFGFTPLEAAQEKYHLMEESWSNKMASCTNREDRIVLVEQEAIVREKIQRIKDCTKFLVHFKEFVTEQSWNERFEMPLALYLEQVADTNMRIFMGMAKDEDKQIHEHRVPKTKVRKPGNESNRENHV